MPCHGSRRGRLFRPLAPTFGRCGLLIVAGLFVATPQAFARITKSKPSASANWSPLLPLTIGSGFEFETDSEQSEYDFPMLFEYNVTEALKLSLEPNIIHIESKTKDVKTVSGFGDLETSLEYEFLRERRYRPAFTALGLIKWPSATNQDIGTRNRDYSLGLIASKDLVLVDLDLNVLYTFVGDPEIEDTLELSLAGEWPLNRFISLPVDFIGEVVKTIGTGGIRGQPGTLGGLGGASGGSDEMEGTMGFGYHVSKFLKLEAGIILRSDLSTQVVCAWEYNFAGED